MTKVELSGLGEGFGRRVAIIGPSSPSEFWNGLHLSQWHPEIEVKEVMRYRGPWICSTEQAPWPNRASHCYQNPRLSLNSRGDGRRVKALMIDGGSLWYVLYQWILPICPICTLMPLTDDPCYGIRRHLQELAGSTFLDIYARDI